MRSLFELAAIVVMALLATVMRSSEAFSVGQGIADITGPSVDVVFMGYANTGQKGEGIHMRVFSRAFVFVDDDSGKRMAYVSTDLAFVTQIVRLYVMRRLEAEFGAGVYTNENVALSGTHTHASPGGYSGYTLFQITSFGFADDNFEAIVEGIFQSIAMAHRNVQPAQIYGNRGILLDANVNRSPYAYDQNPEEERAAYDYNVDKDVVQLKVVSSDGSVDMGLLNWFAVHPTSMNRSNHLVSGDNKGYASYLAERAMHPSGFLPGQNQTFVAAFCSANLGDVSPNIKGAFCTSGPQEGESCDYKTSTCLNDRGLADTRLCHGRGPADCNDKENTRIIGERQFLKAMELYENSTDVLTGTVDYRHSFVEMPTVNVTVDGETVHLCKPAMGYSFAAGTTDGPGAFSFTQGDTTGGPFWDFIRDFLKPPSDELIACQAPKPILLPTGEINLPQPWQAHIVDVQILRAGDLVILVAPGEFSSMAGRRLRSAVGKIFVDAGVIRDDRYVVISGLANTYGDYIVTFEEYQVQRYEGASTIYGPHTLSGYIQEFSRLAQAMVAGVSVPAGPDVPDPREDLFSLIRDPRPDEVPEDTDFGDLVVDVEPSYQRGEEVEVVFWGASPRHNLKLGGSYFTVEIQEGGDWRALYSDANWETELHWKPLDDQGLTGPIQSHTIVRWQTSSSDVVGQYRIVYSSDYLDRLGRLTPFVGYSSVFSLTA